MIAQFALRLLCGMSLMWCIMPRSRVTSGFFRIQMLVALGLCVLAAMAATGVPMSTSLGKPILAPDNLRLVCGGLAVCAFIGSVCWALERRRAGACFGFVIAAGATAALWLAMPANSAAVLSLLGTGSPESAHLCPGILAVRLLSEVSSASMLGGATTAMLLGHWYLTAPTMSIAPLSRLNLFFGTAAVVRLILSCIGLWVGWQLASESSLWLWLVLRWAAGIAGPLVMSVMVWRILKYKNTQSATGVLFVGVILTFIGESTALLIDRELLQLHKLLMAPL